MRRAICYKSKVETDRRSMGTHRTQTVIVFAGLAVEWVWGWGLSMVAVVAVELCFLVQVPALEGLCSLV